jgi:capsular exopolysaccharide synthesis family protein
MDRNAATSELLAFDVLQAARRRKLQILVPILLLGIACLAVAFYLPNVYRSEALVRAEPMTTAHDFVDATGASHTRHVLNVHEQLRRVSEIVTSPEVLSRINSEFNILPDAASPLTDRDLAKLREFVVVRIDDVHELDHGEPRFVPVRIGFEGHDRERVVRIANRLVDLFISKAAEERERRVENVEGFIEAELHPIRKKLEAQTSAIRSYKARAATALPEQASTNLRLLETLQTEYMKKNEAIGDDQARRAAVVEELNELRKQGALERVESTIEKSPAEKRLDELRIAYKEMQARYSPHHPQRRLVEKEIGDLEKATPPQRQDRRDHSPFYLRYLQLRSELETLDRRAGSYQRDQQQLLRQMESYRSRVESAPVHESALADLMRDYTATQVQYQEMLEKQQAAGLAKSFEKMSKEVVFRVVDPARSPLAPIRPKRARIILLGILAGIGLGIALGIFSEQMDSSFQSIDDFQRASNIAVSAVIPPIDGKRTTKAPVASSVVMLANPASIAAEQYRVLAMALQDCLPSQVIMVTSSAGAEGKTITAINLAIAAAGTKNRRVLLVDGDLRRPRVHEYLEVTVKDGMGFGDVLARPGVDIRTFLHQAYGISVLQGSRRAADSIALLSSPNTSEVFAILRNQFDLIVLDSPPVLPMADSLVLAGLADGVLMVVRTGRTPRELFQRAVQTLNSSTIRGVVLNDVDHEHSRYAYAYKYYQKHYAAQR